ncbi:MAG: Caffeine dehydrogenase subunit alpha [Alphaproteobacteria bacterium MarineAlpha11_Bin1]|nr:MAG: Caffeine dehydrogenase subunit alpha [Alphaproteobacteria bacterium MarineAlpha11_Bin1]|tara:strand:- start:9207 stop:11552 length:2346 start_codon:yes stop_codon:yes gene_type:complete
MPDGEKSQGIGANVLRKEDKRFLNGQGRYVSDIARPRMLEAAIVRSTVAHAKNLEVIKPHGEESRVFTANDMASEGVQPIHVVSKFPGHKASDYPHLATGKLRFVGEAIAVCLADTRAAAEDLAEKTEISFDPLPPVIQMLEAVEDHPALVHDDWVDNVILDSRFEENTGDINMAEVSVTRSLRMNRQAVNPLEGSAVLAEWDPRDERLVVHSASQIPHVLKNALCECLGLRQNQVHVVAPDVGGGFGYKCVLIPEEIYIPWVAMQVKRPVRWIQDRREHLVTAANAREHHYSVTLHADREGNFIGVEADIIVDSGAYSVYPHSNILESTMAGRTLHGPYKFSSYKVRSRAVATNKPPIVPYRGVARPGICFAMELAVDAMARELGREPYDLRMQNLVPGDAMPYKTITGGEFDSGDYQEALRRAGSLIDVLSVRKRQAKQEADGCLLGVGFGCYIEMTALQTTAAALAGLAAIPGYEQAHVRLTPDGGLEIGVGVQNHGQGMETTLAQVACERFGMDIDMVAVRHGDTATSPYSTGTYASRSMVMAGGAIARTCDMLGEQIRHIGAHLLQCEFDETRIELASVIGPSGNVTFEEIARVWHRNPEDLPSDINPSGVEVTSGFRPTPDKSPFSYATHACVVSVDPELGQVEILDYVISEDCGTIVNPMIVDGQIIGGALQGVGTALFEESRYDADGQPLSSTFADYTMPGSTHLPNLRLDHLVTPSPLTEYGVKGLGEGGAIPPPAAIANAINDALSGLDVEVTETPMTPRRVLETIANANR